MRNNIIIGFNNKVYDNQMLNFIFKSIALISKSPIKKVCKTLHNLSTEIIQKESRKHAYQLPFRSCDLKEVGGIQTSLKYVGTLLGHELLQELPIKWNETIETLSQVNTIIKYNINDIDITEKLYHKLKDDILSRVDIEKTEGIKCLDLTKSGIGNSLIIKMYSEITGLPKEAFINLRTHRNQVALKDCISPIIKFKANSLNDLLDKIKKVTVNGSGKVDFGEFVQVGKTWYKLGVGGIHDQMNNVIRVAKDGYIIKDADVGSYYPRIIEKFDVYPSHFDSRVKSVYASYTDLRLSIKKTNKVKAEILKIVLNAFYGKYGSDTFFLYDVQAMYSVTLNGQLSLLMLIEELELNGIEVFSANTDGITAYFHKDKEPLYDEICKRWEQYTKLDLEYAYYDEIYMLNCNNYFVIGKNKDGKRDLIKVKGLFATQDDKFDPTKSLSASIIPKAIKELFLNKTPIRKTIEECDDILKFAYCQNKGKDFYYQYKHVQDGELQIDVFNTMTRYYASKSGGLLLKTNGVSTISMISKQNVTLINDIKDPYPKKNEIDYDYYVLEALKFTNELIKGKSPYNKALQKWLKTSKGGKLNPKNQLSFL